MFGEGDAPSRRDTYYATTHQYCHGLAGISRLAAASCEHPSTALPRAARHALRASRFIIIIDIARKTWLARIILHWARAQRRDF